MAIGDVYLHQCKYNVAGSCVSINSAWEMTVGTDDATVAQQLANLLSAAMLLTLRPVIAPDCSLDCQVIHNLLPDTGPSAVFINNCEAGSGSLGSMPQNNAGVIKFITDNPNAKHNGRMYVAGISELEVAAGLIDATFAATELTTRATVFAVAIGPDASGDAVFKPVIVNRQAAGVPIVPPTVSDVLSFIVNNRIFSQKRRKTKITCYG